MECHLLSRLQLINKPLNEPNERIFFLHNSDIRLHLTTFSARCDIARYCYADRECDDIARFKYDSTKLHWTS